MTIHIVQNAYVVPHLENKCRQLFDQFGLGPFVLAPDLQLKEHRYRGKSSEPVVIDAAFAQSGSLNIEIIQMKSTGPNAFRDMFPNGEGGLHHVAYFCDDYVKERDRLEGLGFPVASEFSIGDDVPVCYVDTRAALSHMVELYPRDRLLLDLYERVRNARHTWDGRQLFLDW